MSWLSEFMHSPLDYLHAQPLKALSLLAAPLGALAAPFAAPAIGGALGLGGAAAGGEAAAGGGLLSWLGLGGEGAAAGALGGEAAGLGLAEGTALGAEAAGGLGAGLGAAESGTGLAALLGLPEGALTGDALSAFAASAPAGEGAIPGFAAAESAFPEFASAGGELASAGITEGTALGGEAVAGGAGATEGTAPSGGFLEELLGGAKSQLMKNPLSTAMAAGGLGYSMLQGQKVSPEMAGMSAEAQRLDAQGKELMSYLQAGTLPPGLKAGVDNATKAMKARIIANHARNGMSTDPSQNSALAQELNNVDSQTMAMVAQQGVALMNSGLSMSGLSTQLYGMLEKLNREQAKSTGVAIANFAAALNGAGTRRAA